MELIPGGANHDPADIVGGCLTIVLPALALFAVGFAICCAVNGYWFHAPIGILCAAIFLWPFLPDPS